MRRKASWYQRGEWAAVAGVPGAVVGGVDVEAAVRLAQRPDVGAHLLFGQKSLLRRIR